MTQTIVATFLLLLSAASFVFIGFAAADGHFTPSHGWPAAMAYLGGAIGCQMLPGVWPIYGWFLIIIGIAAGCALFAFAVAGEATGDQGIGLAIIFVTTLTGGYMLVHNA